jgi:sulfur carrier protein ThiS
MKKIKKPFTSFAQEDAFYTMRDSFRKGKFININGKEVCIKRFIDDKGYLKDGIAVDRSGAIVARAKWHDGINAEGIAGFPRVMLDLMTQLGVK